MIVFLNKLFPITMITIYFSACFLLIDTHKHSSNNFPISELIYYFLFSGCSIPLILANVGKLMLEEQFNAIKYLDHILFFDKSCWKISLLIISSDICIKLIELSFKIFVKILYDVLLRQWLFPSNKHFFGNNIVHAVYSIINSKTIKHI